MTAPVRRPARRRRDRTVTALACVLAVLVVLVGAGAVARLAAPAGATLPTITPLPPEPAEVAGPTPVLRIQVAAGMCLASTAYTAGPVAQFVRVPCSSPHRAEVLAVFQIPDGPWPGADTDADGNPLVESCRDYVDPYQAYIPDSVRAEATMTFSTPDEWGWDWAADRMMICGINFPDPSTVRLVGSLLARDDVTPA